MPTLSDTPPDRVQALAREALVYVDPLFNLARRLTGSQPDAEDLVQETYARALGGAGKFSPGTNLRAWLFRILHNAHIDLIRRRRTEAMRSSQMSDAADSQSPNSLNLLRDDREIEQLRRLVSEEISEALQSLPAESRMVILLDLEELTETEIAEVMDCAVGTVKSRLYRARAALRERLRHYARSED
jgi:RNA polymerase sigma-70 factor (ECF subfamily)